MTVRYFSSHLCLFVLNSLFLSQRLSPSLSFGLPLASARALSAAWEDSGVSVTIGWEWCTNTIHLLAGVQIGADRRRVGRTVRRAPEEPSGGNAG